MPRKSFTPEQVIAKLRHIEVGLANANMLPQACRVATISIQSYYRWRKEYRSADHSGEEVQGPGAGEHAAEEAGGGIVAGEGDAVVFRNANVIRGNAEQRAGLHAVTNFAIQSPAMHHEYSLASASA